MPLVVNRDYYLEINGVALACPAWQVTNIGELLNDAGLRGSDRVLPGASGQRGLKRVRDVAVYTFGFEVWGERDVDGTAAADPARKLIQHMDYLKANLGFAKSTGDGTVTAIFHRGAEADLTASVHFLGFTGTQWLPPAAVRTTFDISVPGGVWA